MTTTGRVIAFLRDILLMELAVYRSLARWVARRPDVPPGATAIGYAHLAGPMLWLWIFGSAVEVVVVDVVVGRWVPGLRIPLLIVGVWGVLWMLGLYAAYRVRPHVLTDRVLRIRGGLRTQVEVPREAISSARPMEHELPGIVKTLHLDEDDPSSRLLLVGVSSRTNLEVVLASPTAVATSSGEQTVTRIGLWVDDPRVTAKFLTTSGHAAQLPPWTGN